MILMGVRSPFFLRKMDASTAALLDRAGLRETRVERVVPSRVAPSDAARKARWDVRPVEPDQRMTIRRSEW